MTNSESVAASPVTKRNLWRRLVGSAVVACAALHLWGCSGHEDRTRTALDALDRGYPKVAIAALEEDGRRDARSAASGPHRRQCPAGARSRHHSPGLGDYKGSATVRCRRQGHRGARPLAGAAADADISSPTTPGYKAPAYEKLLLNAVNLKNYLAMGDLGGAKVEARRLAVMQRYVEPQGRQRPPRHRLSGGLREVRRPRRAVAPSTRRCASRSIVASRSLRVLTQGDVLGIGPWSAARRAARGRGQWRRDLVVISFGRVPQKVRCASPSAWR
ncbi:MAG: hypothetical protein WKG00_16765 [Polyangiaceae bacterium]